MDDSVDYRGLRKDSKVILSENKRPYSLKQKKRLNSSGDEEIYWACDTLQVMATTKWCVRLALRSSPATRVARFAGNDDLLCMLLRHESDNMPYDI